MPILICQQCGRMFEVKRYFLYCEKRPDMVKVELEAKEKARCGNTGPNQKN